MNKYKTIAAQVLSSACLVNLGVAFLYMNGLLNISAGTARTVSWGLGFIFFCSLVYTQKSRLDTDQ